MSKQAVFWGLGNLEIWLIQVVIYLLLWLVNDYLATVLCLVFGGIALSLWLLIQLVELVERSKVSRQMMRFMLVCFLAPLTASGLYLLLNQGLNWVK